MFGVETFLNAIGTVISGFFLGVAVIIFLYLKYRQDEEKTIPPLDLIDAKKLDDMVVKQVEASLKPLLLSKGYAEEQINDILTRTAGVGRRFRR